MAEEESIHRIRADFEALKAKLKVSADKLDTERYERITAEILELDETVIKRQIEQRRGSYRVAKLMAELEIRLSAAEELIRDRT